MVSKKFKDAFSGTLGRRTYAKYLAIFCLLLVIEFVLTAYTAGFGQADDLSGFWINALGWTLITIWLALLVSSTLLLASIIVRRLHDIGLSGWFALAVIVPGVLPVLAITLVFLKGPKTHR